MHQSFTMKIIKSGVGAVNTSLTEVVAFKYREEQSPELRIKEYLVKSTEYFFFKLCIFYWVIANEQCCDSFKWTVKWLSHTYTCIHSLPNSPPTQAATWHWAEFPVLSSRSLLVLHVEHRSVSMSIPNSLTIPSPILPPGDHQVITEYWPEFPVLDSRSLLVLHIKYSSVSMSIPDSLNSPLPHPSHRVL